MNERSFRFSADEVAGKRPVALVGASCLILVVAAAVVLFAHAGSSHAESVIRVGVYDFAPLVFVDEAGKPGGLFIDVLEHVAHSAGWHIEYVPGTWEQCLNRVESGEIDLITCIGYSKERAQKIDFTKQFLFLDWGRVYERIGTDWESVFDLEGKRVAVLKGSIYTSGFKSLLNRFEVRAELVEKDNYRQVFRAIEDGEVNAGINGRVAGILLGPEYKIKPTEILFSAVKLWLCHSQRQGKSPPHNVGYFHCSTQGRQELSLLSATEVLDGILYEEVSCFAVVVLGAFLRPPWYAFSHWGSSTS